VSIEQIRVQLPDGSVREVARGTTPFEIANDISPRLAAAVVVARVKPLTSTPPKQSLDGAPDSQPRLAEAAAEFLATGKLDSTVIQKLLASGQVPATLAMKIAVAKNDPEKLKEIAKGLAGPGFGQQDGGQAGVGPGLSFVKPEVKEGEPLKLEILSFLEAVRTRREPKVTARQGRAALDLALTIQATMATHAERAGLGDFFKS